MEKLEKKLAAIKNKLKGASVSPKKPVAPKASSVTSIEKPTAPKAGAALSTKDPEKVAEQIKNPDIKEKAVKEAKKLKEGLSFNSLGQWKL